MIAGVQMNCADVLHRSTWLNFRMPAAAEGYHSAKILRIDVEAAKFNGLIDPEFLKRHVFHLNGKWVDADDEFLSCSGVVKLVRQGSPFLYAPLRSFFGRDITRSHRTPAPRSPLVLLSCSC